MEVNYLYIAAAFGILTFAGAIQSMVGFGYALFATPLLVFMGMPLPTSIITVLVCSFFQAIMGVSHLKDSIAWKSTGLVIPVRTFSLIFGLLLLKKLSGLDPSSIKFVVGLILISLVLFQLIFKVHPKEQVHIVWGIFAFFTSGLLAGIVGMGGPPLVIWSLAHNWTTKKIRGFLFSVFLITIPIQLLLMYFTFGAQILLIAVKALPYAPAVLIGSKIGLPLGNIMPRSLLKKIVYLILLILGISSMIPSILQRFN